MNGPKGWVDTHLTLRLVRWVLTHHPRTAGWVETHLTQRLVRWVLTHLVVGKVS